MAARENQGLQIFLMITVALCVLLAIFTYFFYSWYSDQVAVAESEKSKAQEERRKAAQNEEQNGELKTMMGFSPDTSFDEVQSEFDKDMETWASNFPEDVRFYRKLVEFQFKALGTAEKREAELTDKNKALDGKYAELETNNERQRAIDKEATDKAFGDKVNENDELKNQRAQFEQTSQKMASTADTLRQEKSEIEAAKAKKESEDATEIRKLTSTVASLTQEKAERNQENFEVADGRVRRVDTRNGLVWINVGAADGLRPKTTFKVYDVDENDAHITPSKGSIEVMRLLPGGAMAEARVTSDSVDNPILPGDKIYTPLWHRGRHERFALVGVIDIDGDGKNDVSRVKRLIESTGGIVDAVMEENGKVEGEMSVRTRFLVEGAQPDVAASGDAIINRRAVDNFSGMIDQAQKFGVTRVSVEKFLDHIGWQPETGTRTLGTGATSDGFRPRYIRRSF